MGMRYRIIGKRTEGKCDRKCPGVLARGFRIRLDRERSSFFSHSHARRAKR